jgi:GNAT superfamily N-acetyltransferase
MALEIQIRTAPNIDAKAASDLVRVSFNELAASDWEPNARDVFLSESSPENLEAKVKSCAYAAGAFSGGKMVAFLLMPRPELLGMLFVHPDWLRRGIGKALWEAAREYVEGQVTTVELNATPNAVTSIRHWASCQSPRS